MEEMGVHCTGHLVPAPGSPSHSFSGQGLDVHRRPRFHAKASRISAFRFRVSDFFAFLLFAFCFLIFRRSLSLFAGFSFVPDVMNPGLRWSAPAKGDERRCREAVRQHQTQTRHSGKVSIMQKHTLAFGAASGFAWLKWNHRDGLASPFACSGFAPALKGSGTL